MNPQTGVGSASIGHSKKSPIDSAPLLSLLSASNEILLERGTEGLKKVFLDLVLFLSSFIFLTETLHGNERIFLLMFLFISQAEIGMNLLVL